MLCTQPTCSCILFLDGFLFTEMLTICYVQVFCHRGLYSPKFQYWSLSYALINSLLNIHPLASRYTFTLVYMFMRIFSGFIVITSYPSFIVWACCVGNVVVSFCLFHYCIFAHYLNRRQPLWPGVKTSASRAGLGFAACLLCHVIPVTWQWAL